MRLANKVAIITQAGGSFGRTTAQTRAEEGADLFLQDWEERRDLLEANAKAIRTQLGDALFSVFAMSRRARLLPK